jgi:hypothetical protein
VACSPAAALTACVLLHPEAGREREERVTEERIRREKEEKKRLIFIT